jgi:Ca2+-binding RTX toxin-like protein
VKLRMGAAAALVASIALAQVANAAIAGSTASSIPIDVNTQLPAVTTGDVTVLGPSQVRLTGTVDPNTAGTSYYFEYGANDAFNLRTPSVVISGGLDPTKVGADLLGLQPGTSYSYRLVADSPSGTTKGGTRSFFTRVFGDSIVSLTTGNPVSGAGKGTSKCTIVGTARNDVLKGTKRRDVICGLGGNDRLLGRGGKDLLIGGPGRDRLVGGSGRDQLRGNGGRDRLSSLDHKRGDRLFGGSGTDRAWANKGDRVRSVERIYRR